MRSFFTKKDCQQIAILFNLGFVKSVKPIKQGLWTPKVIATTNKGYFVISKYKTPEKGNEMIKSKESLQNEVDLMKHLKGLPVLVYIKSKNGNYIEDFKSSLVVVDKFIFGKNPKVIRPEMAFQLGEFLASFHLKGKSFKKKIFNRREFYNLPISKIEKMAKNVRLNKNQILKKVADEVKFGVLSNHPIKNLPTGPIHVDLKPENELFINGKLKGIVDFGNFYIGPFMVDIGKIIMWNCCKNKKIDQKLFTAFMKGYESKRKLNKFEISYLRSSILFAIYSHLWVDLYHVSIKYIPEKYTISLVKRFLPVARNMKKLLIKN